ncbi:MAG TPA: fimbria/pilus outer membrane usher protein [Sphingomonas sp.]|nr:fimbria/pilus outer membrane usher protein [Sphingomonas sp.]
MRRSLPLSLTALGLAHAGAAAASSLPPPDPAPADQPLFVELVVNGRASGDIVPMTLRAGMTLVSAGDLRAAGLSVTGDGPMDVARLSGLRAHYDTAGQVLELDATPDLLPTSHIAGEARDRSPAIANVGAMLNYDAYVQRSAGVTTFSLWTEQRLFGPAGTFSNDGTLRASQGSDQPLPQGYLRYDTRYRYIDEDRALTYTAGDLITRSLPWTSSVRLGGIQIARDYHVRPDLLTMPLPSFAGKTAVPSAVDLFVDGYRQQRTDVAPGRFVLDNIPVVNGAGQATIVTTDAVGRQISTTIPFYVASTLLRPGLLDIAGEIGFLRRNYGLKSLSYGALAASGTVRRGLTRHVTVEAHGEASRGIALAGGGLVWSPGLIGTITVSGAASRAGGRTGTLWTVAYSYASRRFSIAAEHDQRDRAYRDLGSFDLAAVSGTARSDRVIASVNFARQGSVGIAYLDGRTLDGPRTRIASLSYARSIGRFANLFLSADRDFSRHSTSAQLRLIVPFGRNSVSGGVSHDPARGTLTQLDYARAIPSQGGFGLNSSLAVDDRGRSYGQGEATWRGRAVEIQAGGAFAQGQNSGWASATGSLVVMDRAWFAANQVTDAFAVVSTEGVAGVPVSYENQRLGITDRSGHLFVPSISAYHPGRFAIDTLGLPVDRMATTIEQRVALRQGAGAVVRMPVRTVHSATLLLVDGHGKPLAAGGVVARPGAAAAEVGWDGIVYLEDLPATETAIEVTRADGRRCRALVTRPVGARPLARIGPVPCL